MPSRDLNSNPRLFNTSKSWVDDIPLCKNSGIGLSENLVFQNNGTLLREHEFEDRSFYCQLDDCTYLYGIFDGHMGTRAAEFAMQRMAAEILLGQLNEKKNDDEIKEIIRQAYISVERCFFDSINDLLAERTSLQCEIPEELNAFDAYQKFPHIFDKLKFINSELSSGTSAVIALIHNKKLYVANVGNSRALLCRTDSNSVLRVVQLSVDHDLRNEDELLRLLQLGIKTENLKYGTQIGNQETTRCLGNYLVKGGYREHKELQLALGEPVIAEPEIHGGINVDESCRFLILMSAGLYKTLEQVIPANDVNKYVAQLIVEQFRTQTTLDDVAQAVVNKTVQFHEELLLKNTDGTSKKHEDITLIIRNFNFPLTNATFPPSSVNSSDLDTTSSTLYNATNNSNSESRIKPYVDFKMYYSNIRFGNSN